MKFACAAALLLLVASAAGGSPASTTLLARAGANSQRPGEVELQASFGASRLGWSLRSDVLGSFRGVDEPAGESAGGIALGAPLWRGLSAEGFAISRLAPGDAGASHGLAGARLIGAGSRGRVWAGLSSTTSARSEVREGPLLQTGGDVSIGRLSITGSLARSATTWHVTIPGPAFYAADTLVPLVTPAREETRRGAGTAVRLGGVWFASRWSVGTTGGVRWDSALPTARWLRAEAAWWLMPRLALSLGVGREAADLWEVGSAPRGTSLALQWTTPRWEVAASRAKAPGAVELRVVNVAGDLRRIEVTAPGARRVEAMGDFTMWEAMEMQRASGGRFVLDVHVAPGLYRVQVRRDDGPWMIPANLPGMDDPDLGGAGAVVVE